MDTCQHSLEFIRDGYVPSLQAWTLGGLLFISCFLLFGTVRYFTRCFLFFICLSITTLSCLPLAMVCNVAGDSRNCHYFMGRLFSFLCRITLRQKYHVLDDKVLHQSQQPVIYICNHQSTLDVAYMGVIFPKQCSVMVKKSLSYIPFFGWYLRMSSTFMIDRKNHSKAIETTSALARTMKDNQTSVLIYPEGTRSGLETPTLLPFKKGAFHLALETGYPIVPIVFSNTSHLYNGRRWRFESGGMGIKVLSPIDPACFSKETINEFVEEAQTSMSRCLEKISAIDYATYPLK